MKSAKVGQVVVSSDTSTYVQLKNGDRVRCHSVGKSFAGKTGRVMDVPDCEWYAWVKFEGFADWVGIDVGNLELLSGGSRVAIMETADEKPKITKAIAEVGATEFITKVETAGTEYERTESGQFSLF